MAPLGELTLPQLLNSVQVLPRMASELVVEELMSNVSFTKDEQVAIVPELWKGVNLPAPDRIDPGELWLADVPENYHEPLRKRYALLLRQKMMEDRYGDRVEPYFLERRADLETIVYGVIRVESQGMAEEFYLRILENEADFGDLAFKYSVGDERYTRGLLGPMPITQPPEAIRNVLQRLPAGEVHPPIRLDRFYLLIRMEHRIAAALDAAMRLRLLQELFEQDIRGSIQAQIQQMLDAPSVERPADDVGKISAQPTPASELATSPNAAAVASAQAQAQTPVAAAAVQTPTARQGQIPTVSPSAAAPGSATPPAVAPQPGTPQPGTPQPGTAQAATPVQVQLPVTHPLAPPFSTEPSVKHPVAAAAAPAPAQTPAPAQVSSQAIDIWALDSDPGEDLIGEIPAAPSQDGPPPGVPLAEASEPSQGPPARVHRLRPFVRSLYRSMRQWFMPEGPQ